MDDYSIRSLYAVVVNWNLRIETVACVESLLTTGVAVDQIIVVDNGSSDDSVSVLRERFGPDLLLIVSSRNLGFAGGANLGIEFALERGAGWVLLLNNDTRVAPTFLAEMENAAVADNQFAILAPLILYQDVPDRIWYAGDRLIPGVLVTYSLRRQQKDHGKLPLLMPVDFVSGCAMLVRRDVFEKVGLFDRTLFMYGEDVDFCWRARLAGFRLVCATHAKMWHKVSVSSNHDKPRMRYWRIKNQIRFYRAYARGLQVPLMMGFTLLRALWIGLGDAWHGQPSLIKPLVQGLIQGWLNRAEVTRKELGWNK